MCAFNSHLPISELSLFFPFLSVWELQLDTFKPKRVQVFHRSHWRNWVVVNSVISLNLSNKFTSLLRNILSFKEAKSPNRNSWVKFFGLYGVAGLTKWFLCSITVLFCLYLFYFYLLLCFSFHIGLAYFFSQSTDQ